MRVLAIDVGGTTVKILATGQSEPRRFASGPTMTPENMVTGVKELAGTWKYDVDCARLPGTRQQRPHRPRTQESRRPAGSTSISRPRSGCPVRIINDAAMQALGSYQGGLLLFLGLGTGLGAAVVADGVVIPMELAHLSCKNQHVPSTTSECAPCGRFGRKKWRKYVAFGAERLIEALAPGRCRIRRRQRAGN